uniref:Uncharacterized protein n=1 Tax=Lepeophtheirus salmonis TaxID=72036 RepID=A0A0K2V0S1_LEPSM
MRHIDASFAVLRSTQDILERNGRVPIKKNIPTKMIPIGHEGKVPHLGRRLEFHANAKGGSTALSLGNHVQFSLKDVVLVFTIGNLQWMSGFE